LLELELPQVSILEGLNLDQDQEKKKNTLSSVLPRLEGGSAHLIKAVSQLKLAGQPLELIILMLAKYAMNKMLMQFLFLVDIILLVLTAQQDVINALYVD